MNPKFRSWLGLVALVAGVGAASQWWSHRNDGALGVEVAALARPGDIRMLASETCSICAAARVWFTENRIPFSECLIERDPACKAAFDAAQAPGTPLLVVRGKNLLGFNPGLVREALRPAA